MPTTTTWDPADPETWDPEACAAAGAALLDADPAWVGWREMVDPDRLNMADGTYRGEPACRACVGAQLHYHQQLEGDEFDRQAEGDYGTFVYALAPSGGYHERHAWQVAHGFIIPDVGTIAEETAAYEDLTAAWRRVLAGSPA